MGGVERDTLGRDWNWGHLDGDVRGNSLESTMVTLGKTASNRRYRG